jgi:hypothetical protein
MEGNQMKNIITLLHMAIAMIIFSAAVSTADYHWLWKYPDGAKLQTGNDLSARPDGGQEDFIDQAGISEYELNPSKLPCLDERNKGSRSLFLVYVMCVI